VPHFVGGRKKERERERKKLVSSHISSAGERKREREKETRIKPHFVGGRKKEREREKEAPILRVHRCRPLTTCKRERERER
jgi:hypothetical protein